MKKEHLCNNYSYKIRGLIMKKIVCLSIFFLLFFISPLSVQAGINKDNTSNGIIKISLTDLKSTINGRDVKVLVTKEDNKYQYNAILNEFYVPLQMGTGEYTVQILVMMEGNKAKVIEGLKFTVDKIDETKMYTYSIPLIEYSVSKKAIPSYKDLVVKIDGNDKKMSTIYDNIVKNISYDTEKAKTVQTGYVPVIDNVFELKKGICYDYSSLLAGSLRSLNIPTRLVMGYRHDIDVYHAWNEVYINGKWIPVDATSDSSLVKAGKSYTLGDIGKVTIIKIY